jgi:hypothetical protein
MNLGANTANLDPTSARYKQHKWRQLYRIHSISDQDNGHKPQYSHTDNRKPNTTNTENPYLILFKLMVGIMRGAEMSLALKRKQQTTG